MPFRYYRRIGNSTGWGLNVSKSGVSTSYRSKYGSIGTNGFSIRTGIPGLSFRKSWGRSGKNAGMGLLIFLALGVMYILTYFAILLLYNLFLALRWLILEAYYYLAKRFNSSSAS